MTELESLVQITLQDAGYTTWLRIDAGDTVIVFEDAVAMGFVVEFPDAELLLRRWQEVELAMLRAHAHDLRGAGEKAWNVYSVFLTAASARGQQARAVRGIEENLERTRKIAASGVSGPDQVAEALMPLLPIQSHPALRSEDLDPVRRLKTLISNISPGAAEAAMDEGVPEARVVGLLGAKP